MVRDAISEEVTSLRAHLANSEKGEQRGICNHRVRRHGESTAALHEHLRNQILRNHSIEGMAAEGGLRLARML
jgi:hypothetical protein